MAGDLFEIQHGIALAIAEEREPVQRVPTDSLKALEAYFRGDEDLNLYTLSGAEDAIAHFEYALETDPDFALAHLGLARALKKKKMYAEALSDDQLTSRADSHIWKALELDPTLSQAYVELANVRKAQGDFHGARRAYEKAIAMDPSNAVAYGAYAWTLENGAFGAYDPKELSRLYRRASELDPHHPVATERLASGLLAAGRQDEALALVEGQAGKNRGDAKAVRALGVFYYRAGGRLDKALAAWRRSYTLDPEHRMLLGWIGHTFWSLGDREEAVWWVERYLQVQQDPLRRLYEETWLLKIAGDDSTREKRVLGGLREHPGDAELLQHLTDIDLARGRAERSHSPLAGGLSRALRTVCRD